MLWVFSLTFKSTIEFKYSFPCRYTKNITFVVFPQSCNLTIRTRIRSYCTRYRVHSLCILCVLLLGKTIVITMLACMYLVRSIFAYYARACPCDVGVCVCFWLRYSFIKLYSYLECTTVKGVFMEMDQTDESDFEAF